MLDIINGYVNFVSKNRDNNFEFPVFILFSSFKIFIVILLPVDERWIDFYRQILDKIETYTKWWEGDARRSIKKLFSGKWSDLAEYNFAPYITQS